MNGAHLVRPATARDTPALERLAEPDSAEPLTGTVLLAEVRGIPVAALSLDDGRIIADPFRHTATAQRDLCARARARRGPGPRRLGGRRTAPVAHAC